MVEKSGTLSIFCARFDRAGEKKSKNIIEFGALAGYGVLVFHILLT